MKSILIGWFALLLTLPSFAQVDLRRVTENTKTIEWLRLDLKTAKDPLAKFHIRSNMAVKYASVEITKENLSEAKIIAKTLLESANKFKTDWDYGNAVHHANLILGRASLFEKNLEEAKRFLKLSAQLSDSSPQLSSFGPNMTLAKELLEKGEKSAVLEYFEDCRKIWKGNAAKDRLDAWRADVVNGKIPDFRGNLLY